MIRANLTVIGGDSMRNASVDFPAMPTVADTIDPYSLLASDINNCDYNGKPLPKLSDFYDKLAVINSIVWMADRRGICLQINASVVEGLRLQDA